MAGKTYWWFFSCFSDICSYLIKHKASLKKTSKEKDREEKIYTGRLQKTTFSTTNNGTKGLFRHPEYKLKKIWEN